MNAVPLNEMTYATFAALLHSRFRVQTGESTPVELELVEATTQQTGPAQVQPGNFSLIFAGPQAAFLVQRTYLFEHEKLGAFHLFIVPIGKDQFGFRYEAVFNRPPNSGIGA